MKKVLLLLLICFSSIFAQNYFPLEVGNIWKYTITHCHNLNCSEWKRTVEVIDDTLVNNRKYFKISGWFFDNNLFYRSDTTGIYFIEKNDITEYLFFDFNLNMDSTHNVGYSDWYSDWSVRLQDSLTYKFFENSPNKSILSYDVHIWPLYSPFSFLENIGVVWFNQMVAIGDQGGSIDGCVISGKPYGIYTDIEDKQDNLSAEFSLSQNYPNPFNPTTKIKFSIPQDVKRQTSNVRLIVYDILGREIKTLLNKPMQPGEYEIEFDGSDLPSGVYFYKFIVNDFNEIKKMILLR